MSEKQEQDQAAARQRLRSALEQARGRLPADALALLLTDEADSVLVEAIGTTGASQWLQQWVADTTGERVPQSATQSRGLMGSADMDGGPHGQQ